MSRFAIKNPYFIIVCCLVIAIVGTTVLVRMPVDLFPPINIPVVVVATFYSGMPPEQIETDITGRFERFFTLGSNIDHIESRSLPGVSLIKIYFQSGTDPDADLSEISNLALADLRKLPPGTLPPVVLKFDASSLPVCLITLKGQGLNETQLRDLGQYNVRNQVANVPGASVPQPFGGRYRQIMVYVDPLKLQAHELSVMDVVRTCQPGKDAGLGSSFGQRSFAHPLNLRAEQEMLYRHSHFFADVGGDDLVITSQNLYVHAQVVEPLQGLRGAVLWRDEEGQET
jgi:hydrophobic/amphiphilic exporter-1 (mainly G- bacteria), HAE1 family